MTSWDILPNKKYIDALLFSDITDLPDMEFITAMPLLGAMYRTIDDYPDPLVKRKIIEELMKYTPNRLVKIAFIALVIYDKCSALLESDIKEVELLAKLGSTAAIALLPIHHLIHNV